MVESYGSTSTGEAMKATLREIDALVAEKVMGLDLNTFGIFKNGIRFTDRDYTNEAHAQGHIDLEDERLQEPHKSYNNGIQVLPCKKNAPHYTADPAASKQVREKLAETWRYRLETWEDGFALGLYRHRYDGIAMFREIANTEELAVVLCSLKSVGIDIEVQD